MWFGVQIGTNANDRRQMKTNQRRLKTHLASMRKLRAVEMKALDAIGVRKLNLTTDGTPNVLT